MQRIRNQITGASVRRLLFVSAVLCGAVACEKANDSDPVALQHKSDSTQASQEVEVQITPAISKGRAEPYASQLLECDVAGWRVTTLGSITDEAGTVWTTPAQVNYHDGPKATDLFNECNDVTLAGQEELDINSIPIVTVDEEGDVFTAYFFGDNYAEIYINGKLIGVDPVPYWPFNTSAVRFRAEKPFVFGAKLVDWEENLSLGSELMRGVPFHTGDGGFVSVLKDKHGETVAITDETWRVQIYYASPLLNAACVKSTNESRNTDKCTSPEKVNAEDGYSARWAVPVGWGDKNYDDSAWTGASIYTNEDIGGSLNRPAYSNFISLFDAQEEDAQFIWSSNLLLDNLVLARKVIE